MDNYKHLEKITKVIKIKADLGKNEVFENIKRELDVILK
jgi:hypothetical protein